MRRWLSIAAILTGLNAASYAGPGGTSGPITVDSTTFVAGSSVMGTDGGVYSDTLPPIASTTTAAFRMTRYRAEHVNLRDSSGVEFGTNGNPLHTTGNTTISISTVQVVNSTISVTGTVSISGTVPVSIAATVPVSLSSTSVTGSSITVTSGNITVTNSGFNVTNSPTVLITSTPAFKLNGATPAGTNNIGTVTGSTVSIQGGVTVDGAVDTTGSSVTITNTGFNINNQPNVYVVNVTTVTPKAASTWNVTGSTVNINGTITTTPGGTQDVRTVSVSTVTPDSGSRWNVTGSTLNVGGTVTTTISGTANVSVSNIPLVSFNGTQNVNVLSVPTVTVGNSSFSVTGSTINIQGTVPVTFSGNVNSYIVNPVTSTITGTVSVNAAQSGTWLTGAQVLNASGTLTTAGYSNGAIAVPSQITDGTNLAGVTDVAGSKGLNVNIIGGGGSGGTSSNYGAAFPTAGSAAGFMGPTGTMFAGRVDSSSNVYVNVATGVNGSTVTVNGTVTAMITGSQSVSVTNSSFSVTGSTITIAGNPTVFVGNTPSVNINNTPNVAVTNTVTTTLSNPLPAGSNAIGSVSINGNIPISISTVSVLIDGSSNTVQAQQSGSWTSTVTQATADNLHASVSISGSSNTVAATQSGSWTDTVTQGTNSNLRASIMIDASSNTVSAIQNGTRWSTAFSTTTTVAVLTSTGITTSVSISTPIAGQTSQTARIFRLVLTADAATTITFRDGSTNFGDSQYLSANGSIVLDLTNEPWYITSSGNGFSIRQSGTANIGVRIWFTQS